MKDDVAGVISEALEYGVRHSRRAPKHHPRPHARLRPRRQGPMTPPRRHRVKGVNWRSKPGFTTWRVTWQVGESEGPAYTAPHCNQALHDGHTAMLLGAARVLKGMEAQLAGRCRLPPG